LTVVDGRGRAALWHRRRDATDAPFEAVVGGEAHDVHASVSVSGTLGADEPRVGRTHGLYDRVRAGIPITQAVDRLILGHPRDLDRHLVVGRIRIDDSLYAHRYHLVVRGPEQGRAGKAKITSRSIVPVSDVDDDLVRHRRRQRVDRVVVSHHELEHEILAAGADQRGFEGGLGGGVSAQNEGSPGDLCPPEAQ